MVVGTVGACGSVETVSVVLVDIAETSDVVGADVVEAAGVVAAAGWSVEI